MRRGWHSSDAAGGAGSSRWTRALAFAGMLAGAAWALAWALRERREVEPRAASRSPAPAPAPAPTPTPRRAPPLDSTPPPAAPHLAPTPRPTPAPLPPAASDLAPAPTPPDPPPTLEAAPPPAPMPPPPSAPPSSLPAEPAPTPPPTLESAPPSPVDDPTTALDPAADAAEAPSSEARLSLTELWVLDGELQGTLANEGDAPARAVTWAMRLVPGYDADNDFGGDPPPVIEATGDHDNPIAAGGAALVTLAEAPAWYLDVQLHPMQLRARYRIEDERGALHESEQSARLVLFHVRSEDELAEIRERYLR